MSRAPYRQLNSVARRVVACSLCLAVGTFSAVPASAVATPQDSTEFAGSTDAAAGADQPDDNAGSGSTATGDSAKEDKPGKSDKTNASKKKASKAKKSSKKSKAAKLKAKAEEKAKVATAKQAIDEMNFLSTRMETAYEDLAQEQKRLKKLKKEVKQTKEDIRNADKALKEARGRVSTWAKATYTSGGVRYMSVLLSATTFGDFVSRLDFMTSITAEEQRLVEEIKDLQKNLSDSNKLLLDKYDEQKRLTSSVSENAALIQNSLIEQADYFAALPSKIRKKVLAYDGVANSISAAAGLTGSTSTEGSHPEVVKAALKYLGVKYVWGGEDPSGFDCSGLTMYCYKKATGKNLTHFARTQYGEGTKIAKSALMPGDLVFFGETVAGIHHVGIYMGNDKFIHAPHTGDVVKISTLSSRSDYIGACRP